MNRLKLPILHGFIIMLITLLLAGCMTLNLHNQESTIEVYNLGLDDFDLLDPTNPSTRNTLFEFFDTNPSKYLVLADGDDSIPTQTDMINTEEERKVLDQLVRIQQYLQDVHGRDGLDNQGSPIRAVLESGGGPMNAGAFWLGREQPELDDLDPLTEWLRSVGANTLPKGHIFLDYRRPPYTPIGSPRSEFFNQYDFLSPGDSMEILAHELGHGIAVNENKFSFLPCFEAGAAFESFADIFGVMVGDDWILGNDHLPGREASAYSRNIQDPWLSRGACSIYFLGDRNTNICAILYGGGPVTAQNSMHQPKHTAEYRSSTSCQSVVHANGGILNYAAYLISQGGSYMQLGNSIVFPGIDATSSIDFIDRSELERLYYHAITTPHLTKNPNFQQIRTALIASAMDLYAENESWKIDTVSHAFEAVGISDGIPPVLTVGTKLAGSVATSSSMELTSGAYATDNDDRTYWEPLPGSGNWIQIDLGQVFELSTARILWNVNADRFMLEKYDIDVSIDGTTWVTVATGDALLNVYGGIQTRIHTLKGNAARYVRLHNMLPRNSLKGTMRIHSFEIYAP